ncbi:MAG: D-glycero-beta-D-manno-heptose 1,7-bisphosphate 7-phosphatase [Nanoarchaeota archaeon]
MSKAIFLDRDGVINEDEGYVGTIEKFKFRNGVFTALKKLQTAGFLLVIVTNQSGIARGYYTEKDYYTVTDFMLEIFEKNNITIAGVYFCPHAPEENCLCRKPKPGMILEARQTLNIDLKKSWMIGDKMSDIEAGKDAGVQTILITSAYVKNVSEKKYDDLAHAVEYILQTDKSI